MFISLKYVVEKPLRRTLPCTYAVASKAPKTRKPRKPRVKVKQTPLKNVSEGAPRTVLDIRAPSNLPRDIPEQKTLSEEVTSNLITRQDYLLRLAGQQQRTLEMKRRFLEVYPNQGCFMISITSRIVGIKSRKTVYNWINNDPDFKKAMSGATIIQRDFVNDILMMLIAKNKTAAVTYFLDRRHPDYMRSRLHLNYEKEKEDWYRAHGYPPDYEEAG